MKRIFLIVTILSVMSGLSAKENYNFLVGTYTSKTSSKGIYNLSVNFDKQKVKINMAAGDVLDPSYLAISPDRKNVYSISEQGESSMISAFVMDAKAGELKPINQVQTAGADPCYVTVSKQHVITANYSGGSVGVFARNADGSLSEVIQTIQHTGNGIDPVRQKKPYVHQTIFSPDMRFVLVNDLGTDYVTAYRYEPSSPKAVLTETDRLKVKLGSGPRHSVFSKDGKYLYLLQEIDGTVSVIGFNNGKLELLDETTVVKKENIKTGAADIHISPDGKFLYATNRGTANDITCFAIRKDGKLSFVDQTSVLGDGPRNFTITKDGKYLLVANQRTHQIVVFKRNKKTGTLTDSGIKIDLPAPVCLQEY